MRRLPSVMLVTILVTAGMAFAGVKEDFNQGVQYYKQGKIAEAMVLFKKVEKKQPKKAVAKYYIALCLLKQNKWDPAIGHANAAIHLNPGLIKAYVAKANGQIGKENYDAALATLKTAKEKAPNNPAVLYTMGITQYYKQDYAAAIATFKNLTTAKPDKAYAYYYLGLSDYAAGRKSDAINAFQRFLELAPDAPEAAQVQELIRRLKG